MPDPAHHSHAEVEGRIPTSTEQLPDAIRPELVELSDGDVFDLEIASVRKRIGDATVRMLAYNRSIPGPILTVGQGSTVTVHVTNHGDIEATVHWHGLRLENRYDGTHDTQAPIPVGEIFTYKVHCPDPGAYWYHPHIREDYGQEMGLYGNILVDPAEPDYWPPVNRELALTLHGSAQLLDADQVARGIAEGAVADPVRLVGRLLDDLGVAGLQPLEGAVEVLGGQVDAGVGSLGHHLGDGAALVVGDAGSGGRWVQDDGRAGLVEGADGDPVHPAVFDVVADLEAEGVAIEGQ
jgi:hypothetical protein